MIIKKYFSITPQMSPALEELLGVIELDIQKKHNLSRKFYSNKQIDIYLDSFIMKDDDIIKA